MLSIYKLILVFTLNLLVSVPLYAEVVEQKQLNFPIKAEDLFKGEIHYYFSILSPEKLAVQQPELFELDSLSLTQESDVRIVFSKTVYIVSRPVGFFDEKQVMEESYVSHVMGDQKVKKLSPDSYQVTVPGEDGHSYKMRSFFDADDLSTLPNSKIITGVTAARKLDVISKGASTIMFTEKTNFTKHVEGGVSVSSFIPMKENKTLVITYNLWGVKRPFPDERSLKSNFVREIKAVKKLQESFK